MPQWEYKTLTYGIEGKVVYSLRFWEDFDPAEVQNLFDMAALAPEDTALRIEGLSPLRVLH